jgi:3-phenylpropionate/trans-cinnamate dioxygenase ferredoxin subunit
VADVHRLELVPPEPGRTLSVEVDGVSILLCNVDGELHAVENQCSHARVPLDEAPLEGCELECPFHGARYDVRDGAAVALPAKKGLRTFAVRRGEGAIEITVE